MLISYVLLFFLSFPYYVLSQIPPKIAIVGAGIGGTSCAYFLNELFQDKASITLFGRVPVGGRLSLIDVDGNKYEAGGAVIHPRNKYMVEFSKLLGLGIRQPESSSTTGIYDGENFVFKESDWYIVTVAKLIWNYGLSVFYLHKDVKSLLDDFSRIYDLQKKGYAYTSVDKLLDAMNPDFTKMTQTTIEKVLLERGYPWRFVQEFVQSVMMVNYGQTNNISGFAGFVSLAGADPHLWSVEGGNKLVPEGLLKKSNCDFLRANVERVILLPEEKYSIQYREVPPGGDLLDEDTKMKNFDIVILCVPLVKNESIKFVNFSENFQQFERQYQQIISTFVKGTLNPAAFNDNSVPDDIVTFNNSLLFNSIGRNSPVASAKQKAGDNVYKVFSKESIKESINKLFKTADIVKEKQWLAYPHYDPPEKFVPFILHPGLYYTNAIELSASAMEMSAISAKNIALLVYNSWKNLEKNIDPRNITWKDEL